MKAKFMHGRRFRGAILERIGLMSAIGGALLLVGMGFYLAERMGDPHWVNRAGAAVVALEGIVAVIEYSRHRRLELLADGPKGSASLIYGAYGIRKADLNRTQFLKREMERARRHVLVVGLLLAAGGELLHGFGDMVYESLIAGETLGTANDHHTGTTP